jgi:D-3-phosphoglycerate dehydrogenase
MFKIQTFNKIAAKGLNQFHPKLYEISPDVQYPDAILVRSHSMHDLPIPSSLKVIGRAGAGVNNIPVSNLTKLGIPVFNTPGANANAVRELVLAGMLLASRHLCQAWDYVRQLQGDDESLHAEIEQHKKQFIGTELLGKTLGVIGLGSIGVKVANAALHLGMDVIGYDPTITVNRAWELSSSVRQAHNIEDLLVHSDFVSLHVPLLDATKHMINPERIRAMKSNVVLLNFARDGIIDNQALFDALNEKKVARYVCDFPCVLLKNHPSVISLPHLGASTHEAEENCAVMLARQVRHYLEYGTITNSANFPTIEAPHHYQGVRIAIVNANVVNMVAQISSKLAAVGLNIISLINKSRDEIAYTLLDVQGDVSKQVLDEIASVEGIIQVRKILSVV